ncbi:hypothetical protein K432DRAFT_409447 [Lepidopterella palustris CBS 459.81]|uniref:Nephrocystin 3-like N-terminal domain-containing protein n=1 Tax=Lepidopterella palustris CBS 459.81 TaxID=1314670 RepID=A0A8E2E083_9PEZI|nr:hypothetical protein K432DRAFT_409447 [Lepidopterella palustris CBS 459.81]
MATEKDRDEKILLKLQEESLSRCLKTITKAIPEIPKPLDHRHAFEDKKGKVLPETCVWLHRHPAYNQIVSSGGNNLLWIRGDPGRGKSMLTLSLIDELTAAAAFANQESGNANATSTTVLYFFFAHGDYGLGPAVALMRSLLF